MNLLTFFDLDLGLQGRGQVELGGRAQLDDAQLLAALNNLADIEIVVDGARQQAGDLADRGDGVALDGVNEEGGLGLVVLGRLWLEGV